MTIFCTTVIATIGRSTLARTVNSVLEQEFSAESHELIVVNDSGQPLPLEPWQQDNRVRIINTMQRERCFARNAGAISAQGRFLHFLDDDDWLLPNALQTLYEWSLNNSADWIYGGSELVTRNGEPIVTLDHQLQGNCFAQIMAGEWIPMQSSLIRTEAFFAIGGFHPLTLVSQDVDLCRRIALNGDVSGTSAPVATIERGEEGSVTQYDRKDFYSRRAREEILDSDGVFERLKASSEGSFWRGRMVRLYATSMVQNIQQRNVSRLVHRTVWMVVCLAYAARDLVSAEFRQALFHPYESPTFARGYAALR